MNDNFSEEKSLNLNPVSITSNVRAPGEYKYYYCGENNVASDKSFLAISTMWYTTTITEKMYLLSSCYTALYTCLLYYDDDIKKYIIFIYKNNLCYKNESISLKAIQIIQLDHSYKDKEKIITKSETSEQPIININVKIFFGGDHYLLLNEIDRRILLIDFTNGNYFTIFDNKGIKSQDLYNIIDTYDENYHLDGELRVRTYAFLGIKTQEKKIFTYKYRYFIIERGFLEKKKVFLHSIDLELGNGEPISIKIAKIPKQNNSTGTGDEKNQQWFYILCFLSSQKLFQLITNYDKMNLYQMLRNINQCDIINEKDEIEENKDGNPNKKSVIFKGIKKDNLSKKNQDYREKEKDKNDNNSTEKVYFWCASVSLWFQTKQLEQTVKIFLNINTKRLCAVILFFGTGAVATFLFNYNDSPEEIKKKITDTPSEIQIDKLDKFKDDIFGPSAKVYIYKDQYLFKSNTICALTSKHLILAIDNKFRIYDLYTKAALYNYHFYQEKIASFLLFEDIGATFLLTWTKVFKIIFNTRFKIFSQNEIKNNPKSKVNEYLPDGMNYPIFEYQPEDVWKSYYSKLEIDSIENKIFKDIKKTHNPYIEEGTNKKENEKKICVICSKEAEFCCSDCQLKNYCCEEHFKYDYNNAHFFECQFVQFFKRRDIMSIEKKEIRYIVLYNELIKLCGRILNFIFTRIFVGKDCHNFLEMLLCLISLLDNFGFDVNFTEFCSCNLSNQAEKNKSIEKILFFQECAYYYAQLQILKCTFTSKCNLYNISDCYLKIIKNDIIPKLTPKTNIKVVTLRCDKLKKRLLFNNEFFQNFQSPVFFDLKKLYNNSECSDYIDIVENYIIKHFITLSTVLKLKIKLHSSIDVKKVIEDITLMFDENFRENKPNKSYSSYCYFSLSFYLVDIGKITQTVKLLKKTVAALDKIDTNTKLKALTYYNLGVLQYALGDYKIGIHNIEVAYKLIVDFHLSEKFKHKVMVSLGLAYLNQRNLFKAYVLIQTSIKELKKIKKQKNEFKCIKLNAYLNYIIDLYEYSFINKARLQTNKTKKDKNFNTNQLLNFVKDGNDKELVVIEQHVNEFLKVVEYIWSLPKKILDQLHSENPKKQNVNTREEVHYDRNLSFTSEQSQTSRFITKDNGVDKEEAQLEYDEDIEVKPQLFDSLTRQQQKDFKELKTAFFKRDIILRDSLGVIEKFNINYDPVYSIQFQNIIEKLKSNFLLKEIFYCFQNEKWRDDLYNFSPNDVLFGLSRYLKLEKIKNVIAIEKSKCLDIIKKEKNDRQSIKEVKETDLLKRINYENSMYPNDNIPMNNLSYITQNNNNMSIFPKKKNEDMTYKQFIKKFEEALKENDNNKNDNKSQSLNLKEDDYLYSLYKYVYLNNPDHDFIFQNPTLILNYIFIDISKNDTKESNELKDEQRRQDDELSRYQNRKSSGFKSIAKKISEKSEHKNKLDNKKKDISSSDNKNNGIETQNNDKIIILRFDNEEDNLQVIKTEEISYCFVRKKTRSATSTFTGRFVPTFGKKKDINKNILKKKSLVSKSLNPNENESTLMTNEKSKTKRKKKRDKSCDNILKIFRNKELPSESEEDISDSKSIVPHKEREDNGEKNKLNTSNREKENLNSNKINDRNYNINPINIEKNNNTIENKMKTFLKKKSNIINNSIEESKNNKKNNNNDIKKNDISLDNKIDINNLYNNKNENNKKSKENTKNDFKTSKPKKNRKNVLTKNNSVKQFNSSLIKNNNINYINDNKQRKKDKKDLTIDTKKELVKPKTYNHFSSEQIKNNNNKENKKIVFNSKNTKIENKNHGRKNRMEQEKEILNGAIEYLKNEFNNIIKINIKDNHIFDSSGITTGAFQHKYKKNNKLFNNIKNKSEYKVPYDYKKKGKQFGEESTISFNSTSSGLLLNKNKSFDESSKLDDNNKRFKDEMQRIIDYNKRLKSCQKENNHNDINISNKQLKRSISQPNFLGNKTVKIMINGDKSTKGKQQLSKSVKNYNPISKKYNNHNYNNANKSTDNIKIKNLKQNHINLFDKKINYSIFNSKSSMNKTSNKFNINNLYNRENSQISFQHLINEIQNLEDKNEDEDDKNEKKFRFVLDKYLKKQKTRNPKKQYIGKMEEKTNKTKKDNKENKLRKDKVKEERKILNNCSKYENSYYHEDEDKKENGNGINKRDKDTFVNKGKNIKNLCDLEEKKRNQININNNRKINTNNINVKNNSIEDEKSNINDITKKEANLSMNKNIESNKDNKSNNNLSNFNISVGVSQNISNIQSVDSSFIRMGEGTNFKEKINLPYYISPQIKKKDLIQFNISNRNSNKNSNRNSNRNSKNYNSNSMDNKSSNISSSSKIKKGIDIIQNQKHNIPQNLLKYKKK